MSKTEKSEVKTERKKPVRRTDEERAQDLRDQLAAIEAKKTSKDRKRHAELTKKIESLDERMDKLNGQRSEAITEINEIEQRLPELASDSLASEG